jgi:hypothetical protein
MANTLQVDIIASLSLQLLGKSANLGLASFQVLDGARAAGGEQYLVVKAFVTEQPLSLIGLAHVSDLIIISDQVIGLTFSSEEPKAASLLPSGSASASASPSAPVTGALYGTVFLVSGAAITSIALSNGSGHDAHVQIVLAGS